MEQLYTSLIAGKRNETNIMLVSLTEQRWGYLMAIGVFIRLKKSLLLFQKFGVKGSFLTVGGPLKQVVVKHIFMLL
jgi:hypothetical protein